MSNKHIKQLFFKHVIIFCSGFVYNFSIAQTDVSDIQKQFNEYQQNNLQEKVYIHTDRSSYLAGEIVWFKVYCLNAATNQLCDLSKVAYAEVLDKDQQPVLQAKISLQKGTGDGSIDLPETLPSGNYIFRAYTNWMKNFGADFYFHKTITILNTIQNRIPVAQKMTKQFDAQFFPEGGNLVSGLQSKVAFRVTDESGSGVNFEGAVVNQDDDTIVRFRPSKFGIGSFVFTPAKSNLYRAVIKPANESAVIQNLPAVLDNGTVMTVTNGLKDDRLKITIHTNTSDAFVYLIIHSQQHINTAAVVTLKDGSGETEADLNKLGEGISHITLFNNTKEPIAERLYFKKVSKKLLVDADADSAQYATRKKVTINVSTKNEAEKTVQANMSMAVYLADSIPRNDEDLFSYLWLSSDLQGRVEHPGYYFSDTSSATKEALDNLMLTHGWRRFKWTDITTGEKPVLRFLPEYEGHIVSGKISDIASGAPAAAKVSYLSIPGKHFRLFTSRSNDEGVVYFNTKDFYGSKLVIAQANGEENSKYRINISSPFSENYSSIKVPAFNFSANAATNLLRYSINMQVKSIYAPDTFYSLPAPVDSSHFFGKPDFRYRLDDYTRFPTMEEVLREYVREINVRKRRDNFELTMVVKDENGNPDIKKPVILLDGVPQFDNGNKITHLDALKIKELEVILDKYYLGPATFDGIASFTTYKGDLDGFEVDTTSTVLDYDALQLKREFYSPVYQTKDELESRLPDFRNLLYWTPDLKTDENGKQQVSFYTSDQPGRYAVVLQGLSASGNAGSKVFMIEVQKQNKPFANNRK
jgi:hypothetical protein